MMLIFLFHSCQDEYHIKNNVEEEVLSNNNSLVNIDYLGQKLTVFKSNGNYFYYDDVILPKKKCD